MSPTAPAAALEAALPPPTPQPLPPRHELLTGSEVAAMIRVNVQTLRASVQRGKFLQPFYVSPMRPRWLKRDVEAWIEEQSQKARAG